ncbi:hypothetical protein FGIG_07123 [Fasciola gigantica]|uniref:LIM zinc-binding domain-containing protein n=1 Tax=Fasciola gigantica TaxID=46835 RepID=A0A504WWH7_FASGI|nr:hypothetical protein FGIG_07123 [Fasciola gigantica]
MLMLMSSLSDSLRSQPQNDPPVQVPDSRPLEELPEATNRLCESSVCTEAEKTIEAIISKSIPEHAVGKIKPNKTHFINRCYVCNSPVYTLEAICVIGRIYHKQCFRCQKCQRVLRLVVFSYNLNLIHARTLFIQSSLIILLFVTEPGEIIYMQLSRRILAK